MTPIRHVLAGLLLAAMPVVAGCGATPAPCSCPEIPPGPSEPAPGMPPGGQGPQVPGASPSQGRDLVARSRAAFMGLRAYELEMKFFQKQGSKTADGVYEIRGKNPRGMRIYIREGGTPGVTIRWDGGSTAKIRPAGLLGAITVSMKLTEERLKSVRGYTLDQTDLMAMYGYMMDPANHVTFLGPGPSGVSVAITGPGLLKGCQRMVASFDPATLMPKAVELSDGREVVFRMSIHNFKPKPNVSLEI